MYNTKLTSGIRVKVYTDFKNDAGYEGEAILIERIHIGETFYEDYEELYKPYVSNSTLISKDKEQTKLNEIYIKIDSYFKSKNPTIKGLKRELVSLCNKNKNSFNNMYRLVEEYRQKYKGKAGIINSLLEFPNKKIVNYIQQTAIPHFAPTLFRYERWLLEFPVEQLDSTNISIFAKPFRTNRNIKILYKISPVLTSKYTSENKKIKQKITGDIIELEYEPSADDIKELEVLLNETFVF